MKKNALGSQNPEFGSMKVMSPLPLDKIEPLVRSEFTGPNGQSVRLVELVGYLMVQKLVEFGLGPAETEWEIKGLAPASLESQAKLMVIFAKLVNEACLEKITASA